MESKIVVVTGFGPFGDHKINASWETVKLLPLISSKKLCIIPREIPVTYKDVDINIPAIWEKYKPNLVVHVGVSSSAEKITIEKRANRTGYCKPDYHTQFLPNKEICSKVEGKDILCCQIDVNDICQKVNSLFEAEIVRVSKDAGRYLCEYTYYKSLNIDSKRTIFVHVPPLNQPFTAEQMADYILQIIKGCLKQLEECGCKTK